MAVGKKIILKKAKGKQYHLPYDIKDVGKNIKWERWEGGLKLGEENQALKHGVGKL